MLKRIVACAFLVIVLGLFLGCDSDELKERKIRDKLSLGQFDEAERLAREYFADDKLLLLTSLSSIAELREKALKEAYKEKLHILHWDSSIEGKGATRITGRLKNTGDRAVSGFALRMTYFKEGKVLKVVTHTQVQDIDPGGSSDFVFQDSALHGYDKRLLEVQDFALR